MNNKKKNKTKSKGLVASAVLVAVAAVVAVLLVGTASAYYPERAGTVGYWHFDEGSGSVAYDSSGEGNDGTIYGAGWTSGKCGGALSFDGVDDRVKLPNSVINGLTDVTSEFWVKTTDTCAGIITGANSGQHNEYLIYWDSANEIMTHIKGQSYPTPVTALTDGNWHHVAVVRSGSEVSVYVDGTFEGNWTDAPTGALTIDPNGLWLGGDQDCVGGCWEEIQQLDGLLDEVRILNRALSAEEILEDYRSTAIIFVTTDKESYTIGETVKMTLELNRSEAVPRVMSLELELKKPGDDVDMLYQSPAFPMPAVFQWNATVSFPIEYSIWIPSGEYCFIGTLRDPSTGDAIASDRACFYVDDVPSKSELEAILAIP